MNSSKEMTEKERLEESVLERRYSGDAYETFDELVNEIELMAERFLAVYEMGIEYSSARNPTMADALDQVVQLRTDQLNLRRANRLIGEIEYRRAMEQLTLAQRYLLTKWPAEAGMMELDLLLAGKLGGDEEQV